MANATPTGMDPTGLFVIGGNFVGGFIGLTNSVFRQTSDVTVANTGTATSMVGTGQGSMTLTANTLVAGTAIRLTGSGVYSTLAVLPGNLTISMSLAGLSFTTATLTGLLLGASNAGFNYSLLMVIRTTGSSGTAAVAGSFNYISALSGARLTGDLNNGGTAVSINTTIDNLLDVKCQWSTASASNTLKSTICNLEVLR